MGVKTRVERLERLADERAERELSAFLDGLSLERLEALTALIDADLAGDPDAPDFEAMTDAELAEYTKGPIIGAAQMLEGFKQMVAELDEKRVVVDWDDESPGPGAEVVRWEDRDFDQFKPVG